MSIIKIIDIKKAGLDEQAEAIRDLMIKNDVDINHVIVDEV